jgi:hypothetical protein
MSTREGIIVLLAGADPDRDRLTKATGESILTIVPVSDAADAPSVAAALVDEGVRRIELCGGLGHEASGKVVEAVADAVPIGAVSFGVDSTDGAASFRDRVAGQVPTTAGFIFRHPGLDPVDDRMVLELGALRTVFVPVPDESSAAAVAVDLVENEDSALIELYRGIGPVGTGQVIDAVGGRAAVGAARYAMS